VSNKMSNVLKCFYSKVRLYTGTNQHVKYHTFFLHKTLEYEKEMLSHFLMSKKCINTVSLCVHKQSHTHTQTHTHTNTLHLFFSWKQTSNQASLKCLFTLAGSESMSEFITTDNMVVQA